MRLRFPLHALGLPPALGDPEATRIATTVHQAGLIFGAISVVWCAVWLLVFPLPTPNALAGAAMAVGVLAPIALARTGRPRAAAVALVAAIWLVTTATLLFTGGISAPGFSTYTIAILIAGLLLGGRAAAATALLSALTGAGLGWLEAIGRLPRPVVDYGLLAVWWVEAVLFLAAGGTLWIALARQREAREAEAIGERLRLGLDQTAEAVLLLDAEMRVLYANAAFDAMTGLETASFIGDRVERIAATAPRRSALLEATREPLERGEPWRERYEIAAPDGSRAVRDGAATPVRGPEGEVVGYVIVIRDVTREVRLEEELRRAQKLEAVGQLAGGVAHDFNNLLTVIVGFLDVLRSEAGGAPGIREPIERIREASERASELTRQLLAFGRRQVTQLRVLELGELAEQTLPLLRSLLPENVEIDWERPRERAPVEADAGALQQLLLNLAANARDAMPEGGRLTLRVARCELREPEDAGGVLLAPGSYVRLEVRDTGVGMDAATRERVFEPFFTTKEPGEGTGLGLASVYGIVDQHCGAIAVDTAPDSGTMMRIHLPSAAGPTERPASASEPAPAAAARATVLVAEDDAAVRRLVCTTLRRRGYEVVEAQDGREALDRMEARERPVDLLLTDVVMPRLSGPHLAEHLRRRWPSLPILFVSGYPKPEAMGAAEIPADAMVLHKPFPPETLLQHVRSALSRSERRAASEARYEPDAGKHRGDRR